MHIMRNFKYVTALLALGFTSTQAADFTSYSGEQLYQRFCSGCHGPQAHGDGKVAKSLGVIVPDLTLLTVRNRGEFPQERIMKIVDGRITIGKHNKDDRTMPVWGEELLRSEQGDPEAERATSDLIHKIVDYLEKIQVTPQKTAK
jgi:mono/diheme cytochrome c family protein